jgi:serine/threonine protein phosphatase PrpC
MSGWPPIPSAGGRPCEVKMSDDTNTAVARGMPGMPPRSPVHVTVGALSHAGKVRPNNEDHYIVAPTSRAFNVLATNLPAGSVAGSFEEAAYALAVADGLGRAAGGEVASSMALRMGTELALRSMRWFLRADEQETRSFLER